MGPPRHKNYDLIISTCAKDTWSDISFICYEFTRQIKSNLRVEHWRPAFKVMKISFRDQRINENLIYPWQNILLFHTKGWTTHILLSILSWNFSRATKLFTFVTYEFLFYSFDKSLFRIIQIISNFNFHVRFQHL